MRKADQKINLSHLCQLFDVPVSSYYYRPVGKPNDEVYRDKLTAIHNENLQSYGRRRMKFALADNGINLGVFKIARLMKQAGIIANVPKKPHYYLSGKQKPNIPNELKRQFNPQQVNTRWVGDITYIRHHQGWSYLATVLDLGLQVPKIPLQHALDLSMDTIKKCLWTRLIDFVDALQN